MLVGTLKEERGNTRSHVREQKFIGMASLLQGLPDVVMCINEPWADDLVGTVKDLCLRRRFDASFDLCNDASLDQEVCLN